MSPETKGNRVTQGDLCAEAMLPRTPMVPPLRLSPRTLSPYMQIPFLDGGRSFKGVDCWGLIYLMYQRELGVVLPTYGAISATELIAIQRRIQTDKTHDTWVPLGDREEQPFDIVVMTGTMRSSEGALRTALVHVGIVVGARHMLHTEDGIGMQYVPFKGAGATKVIVGRVKEIYRHAAFA